MRVTPDTRAAADAPLVKTGRVMNMNLVQKQGPGALMDKLLPGLVAGFRRAWRPSLLLVLITLGFLGHGVYYSVGDYQTYFLPAVMALAIYFVGVEEGATSIFPGMYVHEFVHDGRHLLGFPCH